MITPYYPVFDEKDRMDISLKMDSENLQEITK